MLVHMLEGGESAVGPANTVERGFGSVARRLKKGQKKRLAVRAAAERAVKIVTDGQLQHGEGCVDDVSAKGIGTGSGGMPRRAPWADEAVGDEANGALSIVEENVALVTGVLAVTSDSDTNGCDKAVNGVINGDMNSGFKKPFEEPLATGVETPQGGFKDVFQDGVKENSGRNGVVNGDINDDDTLTTRRRSQRSRRRAAAAARSDAELLAELDGIVKRYTSRPCTDILRAEMLAELDELASSRRSAAPGRR
jgi:hypothetical protein